jgi:hypothetical protein
MECRRESLELLESKYKHKITQVIRNLLVVEWLIINSTGMSLNLESIRAYITSIIQCRGIYVQYRT